MGPNRQDAADVAWPLRRALLLRSLIAQRAPQMMLPEEDGPRLDIDEGVLRAFLLIGEYIHGARSMEAILEMSSLSGRPRFEPSCLPARQQLAVHVDAVAFLDLVHGQASVSASRRTPAPRSAPLPLPHRGMAFDQVTDVVA
jgi:hypothetical protein